MRLRRAAPPPSRRQRLQSEDLAPRPSPFAYRGRRSETPLNTGRQIAREALNPANGKRMVRYGLQRFGLVVLLIAGLISAYNILTLSPSAKVLPLVSGQDKSFLQDQKVYETAAAKLLSSSIWNRNKLTVDSGGINQKMLAQFPELNSVNLTMPLLAHRPLVYIEPGLPALVLSATNGTFVVSSSGKALQRSDNAADLKLPVLIDQSGLRVKLSRQALPADNVKFIQAVLYQLNSKSIGITTMTLPPAASEVDMQIAGQPYVVKFNLQSDKPRQQAGTYLATIAQLQKQNITPGKYVDVRVDGRAYYQ